MNVTTALHARISANKFDHAHALSTEDVLALIAAAMEAPSAYNIQHSRFLVVRDAAARAALKTIAYGQQKVEDAAATIVVLGDIDGAEKLPLIASRAQQAGLFDTAGAAAFIQAGQGAYANKPALARDEAIRSASMAAMALMLAATEHGLASGPMIGFDPEALRTQFNIADRYVPVMMIAVGRAAAGNWPRKPRLSPAEVLVDDARPGQQHAFSAHAAA